MNGAAWTVNCPKKLAMYKEFVDEMYDKHKYVTFEYKLGKPRSIKQNNAMWVFCRDIAKRCNDAGFPCVITSPVLSKPIEAPWTDRSVMDLIWMTVQRALYPEKDESSRQLTTDEVPLVAETIIRHLSEKYGLYVSFPTKEFKNGNKA